MQTGIAQPAPTSTTAGACRRCERVDHGEATIAPIITTSPMPKLIS